MNSAALDSMFNADGSMFYLEHFNRADFLYTVDRTTLQVTRRGELPGTFTYDGAAWDPTTPNVLYALTVDTVNRELWQITFGSPQPLPATLILLHDFSREIPRGGYPSSRVVVTHDSRYFGIVASSLPEGGQDEYDYVAIWDRQGGATRTLKTTDPPIRDTLHSITSDSSGQYLELGTVNRDADHTWYYWHWPSNTVWGPLAIGAPDFYAGGHIAPGNGETITQGGTAFIPDAWNIRQLDAPQTSSFVVGRPRREGRIDWWQDSHATRIVGNPRSFFTSFYTSGLPSSSFTLHSGFVYENVGYIASTSGDLLPPEVLRYKGLDISRVSGVPTAANQWWYDTPNDTLYVWLPDNSNPSIAFEEIAVFDNRPFTDEIVQTLFDGTSWKWRRLAHHRSQYTDFWTIPRGNADPIGSFVLFESNWDGKLGARSDGSSRTDVFLLVVPPLE